MRPPFIIRCSSCGVVTSYSLADTCRHCGQLLEPHYFRAPFYSGLTMKRFAGLLPVQPDRWSDLLDRVPQTPIIRTNYRDAALFLKDETQLTTGSTKDRMAVCALSRLLSHSVKEFVVSSTGNSSSAFIYYSGLLQGQVKCHVFAAATALHRIRYSNPHSTVHAVDGDFVEAGTIGKKFALENGLHWEGGFFNFARREGLKTAYLEAFEQMDYNVDVIIQTVSSGMGILGGYKGFRELIRFGLMNKHPRFVCIQQDTCMPMVRAYNNGLRAMRGDLIVRNPTGLAEAVLRGDPSGSYPHICRMVNETGGKLAAVSQESLVVARKELLSMGINACYASGASFSASRHLRDSGFIRSRDRVLVMLTGAQPERTDQLEDTQRRALAGTTTA